LILRYRERVFGIIYNLCSNREDAADLAQDTFIKAFQSIHRFQGQSSFFTWHLPDRGEFHLHASPKSQVAVVFQPRTGRFR